MVSWNAYWLVLQQDLWRLLGLLAAAGPPLVFLAIGVALVVARRHGRPGQRLLGSTSAIAVFVSLVSGVTSFLLGWGLAHLLYRSMEALAVGVPTWYWILLWVVSFGIAGVLSYRHCAAWVKACLAIAPVEGAQASVASRTSPRRTAPLLASFTLSSLVAYQLILLLAMGIWIECRRDWALEQYAEQQRLADYARWEESIQERFGSHGFNLIYSSLDESERYLSLRRSLPPNWPNSSLDFLKSIEREDGLLVLHVRCDELTDADMRLITRHAGLMQLVLVAPQVTDAGIAELKNAKNLGHLYLSCPQLTDACLDQLPKFQGGVFIESRNFTREAVEAFNQRDGHPSLLVLWNGQPAP